MEHKGAEIKLTPHNYWCLNCAVEAGLMVTADIIIWDEVDLKAIPLCAHCHEIRSSEPNFCYNFSEN